MAKKSSTSSRSKYKLIQDFSHVDVDLIPTLESDDGTLVERTFECNTHGGKNKLWYFRSLSGEVATVSSESTGTVMVSSNKSIPKYKHYVLTDQGWEWVQEVFVDQRLATL